MFSHHKSDWPLQMRAETAAKFCDELHVDAFLDAVALGHYPPPSSRIGGEPKWHRTHLECAINQQHGIAGTAAHNQDIIDLL